MKTIIIENPLEKRRIARTILSDLPDWFGIPEAIENYAEESAAQPFIAAVCEDGEVMGFMTLKETSPYTAELAVCGVKKRFHRCGAGSAMFETLRAFAAGQGYEYLQVKTVAAGMYPEYDATRMFYEHLGFRALEVFPLLWDESNPCLIMVMRL